MRQLLDSLWSLQETIPFDILVDWKSKQIHIQLINKTSSDINLMTQDDIEPKK